MGYITALICLLFAYIGYKKFNNILNPLSFLNLVWAVVLPLSELKLFGMNGASVYVYILILLGIISFSIGCISLLQSNKRIVFAFGKIDNNRKRTENEIPNRVILWIIILFPLIYGYIKFLRALPFLLLGNGMGYVRINYWTVGGAITTSALDYFIDSFFVKGCRMTAEIILINEFARKRKINKAQILCVLATIGLEILTTGGRMVLFDLCTYFVFSLAINGYKSNKRLGHKQKFFIAIIILVAVYIMLYLTMDRQSNNTVLESLYTNFVGGVSLFNTIVESVLRGRHTWGVMFLYGILSVLYTLLNGFFGLSMPQSFSLLNELITPFYQVGSNLTMNAYTTCFLYFYADFGIIGVIIEALIMGLIVGNGFSNIRKNKAPSNVCIYMILLNVLLYTAIRWQLANSAYVLALFLIVIIYEKPKKNINI